MKKVYIILMGLMTSMCLITTSCSNQDEYEEGKYDWDMNAMTMASILPRGDYQGYWTVWNEKADSCVMTFDGNSFSFSKMPVEIILNLINIYISAGSLVGIEHQGLGSYAEIPFNDDIQIEEEPFVVNPVLTGFSEKTVYFKNNIDKAFTVSQYGLLHFNTEQVNLSSNLGYIFGVKNDDKEWYYLLVFDQENYGVINIQQSSRVIKLYLKEVFIQTPAGKIDHMTFDKVVELVFISND